MISKEKLLWLCKIGGVVLVVCAIFFAIITMRRPIEPDPSNEPTSNLSNPDNPLNQLEPDVSGEQPKDYEEIENASGISSLSDAKYLNSTVLTYTYNARGGTISLGVSSPEDGDAIYLNPVCSEATEESKVGFYITSSTFYISYSDSDYQEAAAAKNYSESNVLLNKQNGRDYSLMTPASYRGESEYGAKWQGSMNEGTKLYIRAIRLNDGVLLAICRADIIYSESKGTYELVSLYSADATSTGELSVTDRDTIVWDAIDFMTSDKGPNVGLADADWESEASLAKVEKIPTTYFTKFFNQNNRKSGIQDFPQCDIYAVSFLLIGYGHVTLYYAPYQQLAGLNATHTPDSDELDLRLFGYDAFSPTMLEYLQTPNN